MVGLGVAAFSFLMLMFGIVNSRYFKCGSGPVGFAHEGPARLVLLGRRLERGSAVLFMFAVLGLSILSVGRRL